MTVTGYLPQDVAAAAAAVAEDWAPATPAEAADTLRVMAAAAESIDRVRRTCAAALAAAAQDAPRAGMRLELAAGEEATVALARTVRRRRIDHKAITAAVDDLAGTARWRIDPDNGWDMGYDASRLRLWRRCAAPSWRWGELAAVGIDGDRFCEVVADTKVAVSGDGWKLAPVTAA